MSETEISRRRLELGLALPPLAALSERLPRPRSNGRIPSSLIDFRLTPVASSPSESVTS